MSELKIYYYYVVSIKSSKLADHYHFELINKNSSQNDNDISLIDSVRDILKFVKEEFPIPVKIVKNIFTISYSNTFYYTKAKILQYKTKNYKDTKELLKKFNNGTIATMENIEQLPYEQKTVNIGHFFESHNSSKIKIESIDKNKYDIYNDYDDDDNNSIIINFKSLNFDKEILVENIFLEKDFNISHFLKNKMPFNDKNIF